MYNFNTIKSTQKFYLPPYQYGVNIANKPYWPKGWEWGAKGFDFPDLWHNIKLEIKYFINSLLLKYLRAESLCHNIEYTYNQIQINTNDIYDVIKELNEFQTLHKYLYREPIMLMLGRDIITQFVKDLDNFQFYHTAVQIPYQSDSTIAHNYILFDIPIVFNYLCKGMHILPDYMNKCTYDVLTYIPNNYTFHKKDLFKFNIQEKHLISKMYPQWDKKTGIVKHYIEWIERNV